jgi:hypothetical protein
VQIMKYNKQLREEEAKQKEEGEELGEFIELIDNPTEMFYRLKKLYPDTGPLPPKLAETLSPELAAQYQQLLPKPLIQGTQFETKRKIVVAVVVTFTL